MIKEKHIDITSRKKIKCSCGYYNTEPSKKSKKYKRCRACGRLVDPCEKFKQELIRRIIEIN